MNDKFSLKFNMFNNPELFIVNPDLHKKRFSLTKTIKSVLVLPIKILAFHDLYAYIMFFGGLYAMYWSFTAYLSFFGY